MAPREYSLIGALFLVATITTFDRNNRHQNNNHNKGIKASHQSEFLCRAAISCGSGNLFLR